MKTLIDVLAALSDFVKVASEWAESASKAEVETFTQIYPQKEETVKKAVEKAGDTSTVVTGRINGTPVRVLKNKMTREYVKREKEGAAKAWRQSIV